MSSGNDYVDGYAGLVPARTLKTFLTEAEYIGNLVTESNGVWKIDPAAYVRLLKAMYADKYIRAIPKEIPRAKNKKGKDLETFWKEDLTWGELREIVKNHNKKNGRAHIPSAKLVWLRFLRLQFNLEILRIGYFSKPENIDSESLKYGFSLIQQDRPLTFHNVRITEEADAECQPIRIFLRCMDETVPPSPQREEIN
jgi:hypothetical protein